MPAHHALALAPRAIEVPNRDLAASVRVLTCGSVDDGKSTLIGRLLWDASDLFDDQREALHRSERRVLDGKHLDYSLLVDGLIAEREQGITIDIAWRTFDTAERRFVIIDSPGHEQYTRNMASGASHADIAVMLIDARHGIKRQTRRHAAILDLFGVRRVVLAVNKMDLVGWSAQRFREIEADFKALQQSFGFEDAVVIPVAAVTGDNVARRSQRMRWYAGPTLLEQLSREPVVASLSRQPFRFPVQNVLRDGQDFRGLAGIVASGRIAVGETIVDTVSGREARIRRIATMDGDLASARHGQAVALVLDRDLDVSRGAVLAVPEARPTAARSLEARLVWLSEQAFDPSHRYLLRSATDLAPVSNLAITSLLDLATLERSQSRSCAVNEIAVAEIELGRPAALDTFAVSPVTGSFVLVDAVSGATVAGGVVTAARSVARAVADTDGDNAFVVTRDMLARGVCADLAATAGNEAEFRRRAAAIIALMQSAGIVARSQID